MMKENKLTFTTLREANLARLPQFTDRNGRRCHAQADGSDWTPAEWLQATVGELGELANLLKKVKRGDMLLDEAMPEIRKEFADIVTYLDIWALQFGVDLGEAVAEKFNEVSNRIGCRVFINGNAVLPVEYLESATQ
jgi:NTP pyrophosphatase (non-canonical NTP hydrolase)